jgi:hypothetical protein
MITYFELLSMRKISKKRVETRNRLIKELFLIVFGIILCGIPLAVISTLYAQESELTLFILSNTHFIFKNISIVNSSTSSTSM